MPTAILADPTDYGNAPGEGSLRPGGQGMPKQMAKRDLPSTTSAAVDRQAKALAMVRDIWGGTEVVRSRGQVYLPQAPGEEPENYATRLNRSVFFNAFRRTVEGLVGLVFQKDPKLGDDVPPLIAEHWENIDLEGKHGDVFLRELLQDVLVAGHAAILVEFPHTDGEQTAADEMTEIRPYWVPIRKDDIVSWRTETVNGRNVLSQLVIRETAMVADGEFGERKEVRYRVLYRSDGVVGFRLLEVTENQAVVEHEAGIYPTQDEIPIAEVTSSGSRSMFDSDPPLKDLAYLNIAHYQWWSDYATASFMTNVPFLFTAGVVMQDEQGRPITVGPNTSLSAPDPNAKAEYVSHDGASLGASKQALDDLKADMGTMGLAMLAPQKRVAETAEAKRLDKATSESALAVTARGEQDAVEVALGYHAKYLRLPSGGSVQINRDFEGLLLEGNVMDAFARLVTAGFPPGPVLRALQMGGRIAEDEDLEALELQWMAGAAANEVAREQANFDGAM